MQKRGQVYLLAALIIGFILFTLVAQSNIVRKNVIEDDFEELSLNYERESAAFVNNLLTSSSPNLGDDFLKFTILFTSFSKTKNPEFGLIYAFLYEDQVFIGNYLDSPITLVNYPFPNVLEGCFDKVKTSVSVAGLDITTPGVSVSEFSSCTTQVAPLSTNVLTVQVEDIAYDISLTDDNPEIMIVSRETKAQQRKVFLKGNFIKGRDV